MLEAEAHPREGYAPEKKEHARLHEDIAIKEEARMRQSNAPEEEARPRKEDVVEEEAHPRKDSARARAQRRRARE